MSSSLARFSCRCACDGKWAHPKSVFPPCVTCKLVDRHCVRLLARSIVCIGAKMASHIRCTTGTQWTRSVPPRPRPGAHSVSH